MDMDNVQGMLRLALDGFDQRVRSVREDQWVLATPCGEWTVRDLVNHLVFVQRWTPVLVNGINPADAGTPLEGDLLGDAPVTAWENAKEATLETARCADLSRRVSTPYGELSAGEFLALNTSETCIHTWDLARGISADETLDPSLVQAVMDRYRNDHLYNGSAPAQSWPTLFDPAVGTGSGADLQDQLIALTGRNPKGT